MALRLSEGLGIGVRASEERCAGHGPVILAEDLSCDAYSAQMKLDAPAS